VVYKRRVTLTLEDAYKFIETAVPPPQKTKRFVTDQVFRELSESIKFYNPLPAVYLAYDRIAYFGKEKSEGGPGRGLRISFDFNVRTRREDVRLESGDHGESLVEGDFFIMEVKSGELLPRWLINYFGENDVRRGSFSKYGEEYKRYLGRIAAGENQAAADISVTAGSMANS
jgi:hypothetical protein